MPVQHLNWQSGILCNSNALKIVVKMKRQPFSYKYYIFVQFSLLGKWLGAMIVFYSSLDWSLGLLHKFFTKKVIGKQNYSIISTTLIVKKFMKETKGLIKRSVWEDRSLQSLSQVSKFKFYYKFLAYYLHIKF